MNDAEVMNLLPRMGEVAGALCAAPFVVFIALGVLAGCAYVGMVERRK